MIKSVKSENENAPVVGRGARENFKSTSQSKPQPPPKSNQNQDYEDKRMASACFSNENKREEWMADYTGVMVTDDLPANTKCWVNVRERISKTGRRYLSVVLRPQDSISRR
jgi:hypothetical protein